MTDHDEDDPQLKSLRAVWLSMPDEDPPERGLAELMMAARTKAEHMAKPSWWQQVLAVLRRPAVLALASVMVLLGGVVLLGRRGDKMEAPPSVQSPAVEQVPESTRNVEKSEQAPAMKSEPVDRPREPSRALRPLHEPPPLPPAPQAARTPVGEREAGAADAESPAGLATGRPAAPESPSAATAPTPAPPKTTAAPRQESRSLVQARAAATRGDCDAARAIANGIAKQDPQYYKDVVMADASIKKCVLRE